MTVRGPLPPYIIPTDPALTALQAKVASDLTTEQAAIVALAARTAALETRATADESAIAKLLGTVVTLILKAIAGNRIVTLSWT
jgi:hypothetical protein